MEPWRKKAVQLLPKLQRGILEAESIGMLWTVLCPAFVRAHEDPADDDRIRAIYAFARWAMEAGDHGPGDRCMDEDWASSTVLHFYEDLPTEPKVAARIPEFMSREDILGFSDVFKYYLTPDEHAKFMAGVLTAAGHQKQTSIKKA